MELCSCFFRRLARGNKWTHIACCMDTRRWIYCGGVNKQVDKSSHASSKSLAYTIDIKYLWKENSERFSSILNQRLKEQFIQNWTVNQLGLTLTWWGPEGHFKNPEKNHDINRLLYSMSPRVFSLPVLAFLPCVDPCLVLPSVCYSSS